MIAALGQLGVAVDVRDAGRTLRLGGCGGVLPARRADLFVANSGTTMRFLTALVALGHGKFRLHGVRRMHERPIGDLVDGLRQLGAELDCESPHDCPPVVVHAAGLRGGRANVARRRFQPVPQRPVNGVALRRPRRRPLRRGPARFPSLCGNDPPRHGRLRRRSRRGRRLPRNSRFSRAPLPRPRFLASNPTPRPPATSSPPRRSPAAA